MDQKKIDFELKTEIIFVPACIVRWNKKKRKYINYYLNLNQYIQWDKFLRNNIKKDFTKKVKHKMILLPEMSKIHSLSYTLITPNKRKRDRMNAYSIIDKFFCDALQEHGVIKDDSDNYISDFKFTKTEYVKGEEIDIKARVEIYYETK